jgi:hypothetical protein
MVLNSNFFYKNYRYFLEGSFHPYLEKLAEELTKNNRIFTKAIVSDIKKTDSGVEIKIGDKVIKSKTAVIS